MKLLRPRKVISGSVHKNLSKFRRNFSKIKKDKKFLLKLRFRKIKQAYTNPTSLYKLGSLNILKGVIATASRNPIRSARHGFKKFLKRLVLKNFERTFKRNRFNTSNLDALLRYNFRMSFKMWAHWKALTVDNSKKIIRDYARAYKEKSLKQRIRKLRWVLKGISKKKKWKSNKSK